MSEDTPVNTGVVVWPDSDSAYFTVRRMQTKLHRWAVEDPDRRFDDLYNLVYDPAFLVAAWERVATNRGARTAGVDRVTVAAIETGVGVAAFLGRIRDALKDGGFQPIEVREVAIPKGTTGKFRKLRIPTVADRVVQASLKQVLEPIFEADFKPCSYGFRPRRGAHDAISEIHFLASRPRNYEWVFEADITACFDEIEHTPLMNRMRMRVKDKRICALVKAFLKSGVMTQTRGREETYTGAPQGGILSPLLANIALSALDEHFIAKWDALGNNNARIRHRRRGGATYKLVRFADDFVVMVRGERHHAEALRAEVSAVLAPWGLRLAPEKTRVAHIDEGFDFLGFTIRRLRKRGTMKHYVYTVPSRKAVQAIRDKVKVRTHRSTRHMPLDVMLRGVNRLLVGWANYFRYGVSKAVFYAVDSHAWSRLMRWIRNKYAGKSKLGMPELKRRFCDRGWRFAYNGVVFTGASSVAVTRYRYRGHSIRTPWTPIPERSTVLASG